MSWSGTMADRDREVPVGGGFLSPVRDQERDCEARFGEWMLTAGLQAPPLDRYRWTAEQAGSGGRGLRRAYRGTGARTHPALPHRRAAGRGLRAGIHARLSRAPSGSSIPVRARGWNRPRARSRMAISRGRARSRCARSTADRSEPSSSRSVVPLPRGRSVDCPLIGRIWSSVQSRNTSRDGVGGG